MVDRSDPGPGRGGVQEFAKMRALSDDDAARGAARRRRARALQRRARGEALRTIRGSDLELLEREAHPCVDRLAAFAPLAEVRFVGVRNAGSERAREHGTSGAALRRGASGRGRKRT
jgi:hypothetical protein